MATTPNRARRLLLSTAAVAGLSLGAAGVASAATSTATPVPSNSSSPSTSAPASQGSAPSGAQDPSTLTHGPGETLLTGTDLATATAAAEAAEPGATIIRVETDSSGAGTYEAHMKTSDGTIVTVEMDSSFHVTSTESGFGEGPAGQSAPSGAPSGAPAGPSTQGSTSSSTN